MNPKTQNASMQLTYRYRIKDKHAARLNAQARAVNVVFNYCNETQQKAVRDGRKWLTGYDLWKLVAGATKEGLNLHSHSAMRICVQYDKSRRQQKKPWLRWRSKRSLGWVPFNTGHVQLRDGAFVFRGERYDVWLHRPLPEGAKIGAGSFSQDTRGRWFINCPVEMAEARQAPLKYVGVDLGLKDLAALSTGEKIELRDSIVTARRSSPRPSARVRPGAPKRFTARSPTAVRIFSTRRAASSPRNTGLSSSAT
jgi:putative transposase